MFGEAIAWLKEATGLSEDFLRSRTVAEVKGLADLVAKFNPHHDRRGRFGACPGGHGGGGGGGSGSGGGAGGDIPGRAEALAAVAAARDRGLDVQITAGPPADPAEHRAAGKAESSGLVGVASRAEPKVRVVRDGDRTTHVWEDDHPAHTYPHPRKAGRWVSEHVAPEREGGPSRLTFADKERALAASERYARTGFPDSHLYRRRQSLATDDLGKAVRRLIEDHEGWGGVLAAEISLRIKVLLPTGAKSLDDVEVKFNPHHDRRGRFGPCPGGHGGGGSGSGGGAASREKDEDDEEGRYWPVNAETLKANVEPPRDEKAREILEKFLADSKFIGFARAKPAEAAHILRAASIVANEHIRPHIDMSRDEKGLPRHTAFYDPFTTTIGLNGLSSHWKDPASASAFGHRTGYYSSPHPDSVAHHEVGHALHYRRWQWAGSEEWGKWDAKVVDLIGKHVSKYATTNPREFVAETYAGLRAGKQYPPEIMERYRKLWGPKVEESKALGDVEAKFNPHHDRRGRFGPCPGGHGGGGSGGGGGGASEHRDAAEASFAEAVERTVSACREAGVEAQVIIADALTLGVDPAAFEPGRAKQVGLSGRPPRILLNPKSPYWKDPEGYARRLHESGFSSSAGAMRVVDHEVGHVVHASLLKPPEVKRGGAWSVPMSSAPGGGYQIMPRSAIEKAVGKYAATSPMEFVAEVYAGMRAGKRYGDDVMWQYQALRGPSPSASKPERYFHDKPIREVTFYHGDERRPSPGPLPRWWNRSR